MNRSLYIAATGMNAQQAQMDVISNNLANTSTNGFKASRAVFEDLLYQTIRQPGANSTQQTELPSGLQLGTGVQQVATERLYTQGGLTQTGNSKDVAINGAGFFQVLMPDGTNAYTRDGSFQTNAQGQLVTSSGYQILPAITVPQNAQSLTIGKDGAVVKVDMHGTAVSIPAERAHATSGKGWVGIRPEKVLIAPAGEPIHAPGNHMTGAVVVDSSFMGVSTQYLVKMAWGQEILCHEQNTGKRGVMPPGTPVDVSWRPEFAFLLDASQDADAGIEED